MKKVKFVILSFMVAIGASAYSQSSNSNVKPKVIAVVNAAKWCGVCKANGDRFGKTLNAYSQKGVSVFVNDLSDNESKASSQKVLVENKINESANSTPRKGVGKMLKACRMVGDKKLVGDVAGIVSFIDPVSKKLLKQVSISVSDEEMIKIIDNLLK